jgi:hypothetical protein
MIAVAIAAPRAQDAASAVSVDRVRTALQRPPSKLTLTERKPDFSVQVVWHHRFHEIFDAPPWATPPVGWQAPAVPRTAFGTVPIVNVDLLAIAGSLASARRAGAERQASEDVRRAIVEYCAAQSDGGAGIQICSTSTAIR